MPVDADPGSNVDLVSHIINKWQKIANNEVAKGGASVQVQFFQPV